MECVKNVPFELAVETVNLEGTGLTLGVKHTLTLCKKKTFLKH